MKVVTIIVSVLIASYCDAASLHRTFPIELGGINQKLTGAHTLESNKVPWLVLIFKISATDVTMGYGAIIGQKWVITTSQVVSAVGTQPDDVNVFSDIKDASVLSSAINHKAVQIVTHDNITNTKHALSLIQICPPLATGTKIDLPAAGTVYSTANTAKMYRYFGSLLEAAKSVGLPSACEGTADWDPNFMLCLAVDSHVHSDSWDEYIPVVIDDKLAGFLMISQNGTKGEQVLDISKYRDWIMHFTGI